MKSSTFATVPKLVLSALLILGGSAAMVATSAPKPAQAGVVVSVGVRGYVPVYGPAYVPPYAPAPYYAGYAPPYYPGYVPPYYPGYVPGPPAVYVHPAWYGPRWRYAHYYRRGYWGGRWYR